VIATEKLMVCFVLMMIFCRKSKRKMKRLEVFKLNFNGKQLKWYKVESIGNFAILFGNHLSLINAWDLHGTDEGVYTPVLLVALTYKTLG